MRNSGCFDAECVCDKADDGILSDIVICMNQWCPATVTATDLIEPLEGECNLPKSAVQDAEKKGGVADDTNDTSSTSAKPTATGDDNDDETSSAKPTATSTANKNKGGDDGDDDVTVTFDVGPPQTNPGSPATTVKPAISGTLTVNAGTTSAPTTGLLTDEDTTPTATGSLAAETSVPATSSSTAAKGNSTGSPSDEGNAARLTGQASIFGVVAAMGAALALGF